MTTASTAASVKRPSDPAAAYLAQRYGPNFRAILGLGEPGSQPYAEHDDSAFWDFFGDLDGDPAPDLTAHRQVAAELGR